MNEAITNKVKKQEMKMMPVKEESIEAESSMYKNNVEIVEMLD